MYFYKKGVKVERIDREEFNKLLERAKLSKKDFASIVGVQYKTVNGWGSPHKIPYWVKSWFENYIKSSELKNIDELISRRAEEQKSS